MKDLLIQFESCDEIINWGEFPRPKVGVIHNRSGRSRLDRPRGSSGPRQTVCSGRADGKEGLLTEKRMEETS